MRFRKGARIIERRIPAGQADGANENLKGMRRSWRAASRRDGRTGRTSSETIRRSLSVASRKDGRTGRTSPKENAQIFERRTPAGRTDGANDPPKRMRRPLSAASRRDGRTGRMSPRKCADLRAPHHGGTDGRAEQAPRRMHKSLSAASRRDRRTGRTSPKKDTQIFERRIPAGRMDGANEPQNRCADL